MVEKIFIILRLLPPVLSQVMVVVHRHKVGEIKTVKVKIINAQLGAIGYMESVLTDARVTMKFK